MPVYSSENDFYRALSRFNAFSSERNGWHTAVSESDQVCEFGYTIPAGEQYFKKYISDEGEEALRLSRNAMERVVFLAVDCDTAARQISEALYLKRHPKRSVLEMKRLR